MKRGKINCGVARKLIVGAISGGRERQLVRMIENDRTNINDAYGECGMSGYVLMRFYNVNGFLRLCATSCLQRQSLLPSFFQTQSEKPVALKAALCRNIVKNVST